jgi:hypothetical protein
MPEVWKIQYRPVTGCSAYELRAAATSIDLARQFTGLPHPLTALTPARILLA